jgi:Trp operon repressor
MNDARQFIISYTQLDALRKNIPASVDESTVNQYHSIVDFLQTSSGEDLSHFRISQTEVKPRVVSFRPGGYGGGPGQVQYSSKKFCEEAYFKRQVEALWQYIQTIKSSSDKRQTGSLRDYWSMSDNELERIATELKIQPLTRTGPRLESWFVDRARIIDALIKRDESLRSGNPTPQALNTVHVENMYGSSIQQGTHGSNATVNFKAKESDLRNVLNQIQDSVDQLELSPAAKGQLEVDIGTINVQLSATSPKASIISECLHSVRTILETAVGHVLALSFLSQLGKFGG